VLSVKWISLDR